MMFPLLLVYGCVREAPPCRAEVAAWEDLDADGFGGGSLGLVCELGPGQAGVGLDCDDAAPGIHPGARERCDQVDQDCDGEVDEDKAVRRWWADADGDGFGASFPSELSCDPPEAVGWVENADDCDDADPAVNPDAVERCGGGDEDCDGQYDDDDDEVAEDSLRDFYLDLDRDGAGDPARPRRQCRLPLGAVENDDDCDDADPQRGPLVPEVCDDGVDNDCDALADDDDDSLDLLTATAWYRDADRDGYGDDATIRLACERPAGHLATGGDCDDQDPDVHEVQSWRRDADGDGFGAGPPSAPSCQPPQVGYSAVLELDCADDDADIHPDAEDVCDDGVDSDCDGEECDPCTEVVVGILPRLAGPTPQSPDYVFRDIARDWALYGDCPLRAVTVQRPLTLQRLIDSDATMLWGSNLGSYLPQGYDPAEVAAIHDFVEGGHGGLATTFIVRGLGDMRNLLDLVGVDGAQVGSNTVPCSTVVNLLEPAHPLATALPPAFDLVSHPHAQRANGAWSAALLPGATIVTSSTDGLDVLVGYDNGQFRGAYVSTMLDYDPPSPESRQMSYNVAHWVSGFDP